jgi:hypothetical protein
MLADLRSYRLRTADTMLADDALKFRPILSLDVVETDDAEFMAAVLVSLSPADDAMTEALVMATVRWMLSVAPADTADALAIATARGMVSDATAATEDALAIDAARGMVSDADAATVEALAMDADLLSFRLETADTFDAD